MEHKKALLLAVGSILLGGVIDVVAQQGMMWTESDYPKVVGMSSGPACPGFVLADNTLTYTEHGIAEGYFAVGQGFTGMMHKQNPALHRIRENLHKDVELVLRVKEPRKLEAIGR